MITTPISVSSSEIQIGETRILQAKKLVSQSNQSETFAGKRVLALRCANDSTKSE